VVAATSTLLLCAAGRIFTVAVRWAIVLVLKIICPEKFVGVNVVVSSTGIGANGLQLQEVGDFHHKC